MKSLTIGDWVQVQAVSEMQYIDGGERAAVRRPVEPFHAQVVGLATRQRGYYSKGPSVAASFYSEFDFVEASLSVTGTLKVWLVRGGMMNKELEVADDDLEPTMGQERAPMRRIGVPVFLEDN